MHGDQYLAGAQLWNGQSMDRQDLGTATFVEGGCTHRVRHGTRVRDGGRRDRKDRDDDDCQQGECSHGSSLTVTAVVRVHGQFVRNAESRLPLIESLIAMK